MSRQPSQAVIEAVELSMRERLNLPGPMRRTHGYSEMSVGETRFGTFGDLMRWMQ